MWLPDDRVRLRHAKALAQDGATAADLEEVCAFIERQAGHDPERTGQRLAGILKPGGWQRTLETARKHAKRRAEGGAPGEHDHGATRRAEDDACQAEARRLDHYKSGQAYARLFYEQARPRALAKELGVSVDKLPALVRAGAEQYGADPDAAAELLRKAVER